jgi:hypothetical protein
LWKNNITGWVLLTILSAAAVATVAAWILPWYFEGNPIAILTARCAGVGAIVLAILVHRLGRGISCGLGIAFAIIASFMLITNFSVNWDWGASFNRAARTARVVRKLIQQNQEYARHHQGSFAVRLDQLGIDATSDGYTVVYDPVWGPDHLVRHYVVRAIPPQAWWRSFYADDSGVIRFRDSLLAEKDSTPI